ncbi:hypothetical protein Dsin_012185 [Dipteronia sinensis]|uniref:Uncharacterized protein n=1 Tax=Dipteronia sinensis TaxID=43782 RepID=A0AAE0E970_9ROSI|nr:hypothetical protein Dsin_012185 [Dipteronia sinensis]
MVNLAKRKVVVDGFCPIYSPSFETKIHALWGCPGLKVVRARYGMFEGDWYGDRSSFQDFFSSCLNILEIHEVELLCMIWWRVWYMRNQWVHGSGNHDMEMVVFWSRDYLQEFVTANLKVVDQGGRGKDVVSRWQPPSSSFYKLNTNATINEQNHRVSLGMVVKGSHGFGLGC